MIVLPVLYSIVDASKFTFLRSSKAKSVTLILFALVSFTAVGQQRELSMEEAIQWALVNNMEYQAAQLHEKQSDQLIGTAYDLEKTGFYYNYDQSNIGENNVPLSIFGIQQNFDFPTVYNRQRRVNQFDYRLKTIQTKILEREISKKVSQDYNQVVFHQKKLQLYMYLDSLYQGFAIAASRKYELGETNYLEMLTAQSKRNQLSMQVRQVKQDLISAMTELQAIVQSDSVFTVGIQELAVQLIDTSSKEISPGIAFMQMQTKMSEEQIRLEQSRFLPGFQLEYYLSTNGAPNHKSYNAYQIGLTLPLWFKPQNKRLAASRIQHEIAINMRYDYALKLKSKRDQLLAALLKHKEPIIYYQSTGETLAEEISRTAQKAYANGEIDFFQYIQSLENATSIVLEYLDNLVNYNEVVFEINYMNL